MWIGKGLKGRAARAPTWLLSLLLTACGGGIFAIVAQFFGSVAPASVPLVLFPGGEERKPALLLPFTAEVRALALSPDGLRLYAGDILHNTVNVIDTANRKVIAVLDVGTGPRGLLVSADNQRLYVAHYGRRADPARLVSAIDTQTFATLAEIPVGGRPFAMLENADQQRLYVASLGAQEVVAIDTASLSPLRKLVTDGEPAALAQSADGSLLYIAVRSTDNLAVSDRVIGHLPADFALGASNNTPAVSVTLNSGDRPRSLLLTPNGQQLLALAPGNQGSLWLIDTRSHAKTELVIGTGVAAVAVSPNSQRAYVARGLNSVADTDNDDEDLCAADSGPTPRNTLAVLDLQTAQVLANDIAVGDAPIAVVLFGDDGDGGASKAFTLSACADPITGEGSLSRLSTASISSSTPQVSQIPLPARGVAAVIDASGNELWLAHPDAVSLFDPSSETLGATIAVRGPGPTRLALSPSGDRLHALLPGRNEMATLAVNTLQASEVLLTRSSTGSRPSALDVTANGTVVVANGGFSRTPDTRASLFNSSNGGPLGEVSLADADDSSLLAYGPISVASAGSGAPNTAYLASFGTYFPNNRSPTDPAPFAGNFVSQLNTASRAVENIDTRDDAGDTQIDWLSAVAVDRQAQINNTPPGAGSVTACTPSVCNSDVLYSASHYRNRVFRHNDTPFSNAAANVYDFSVINPAKLLLDREHNLWVSQYEINATVTLPGGRQVNGSELLRIDPRAYSNFGLDNQTAQPLPGALSAKMALGPDDRLWALHAGDRNYFCRVDSHFCGVDNAVSVVNLADVPQPIGDVPRIEVGRSPRGIAFAAGHAFVSHYFDGTVSVIDSSTLNVVGTIIVGAGPLDVLAMGNRVYVANSIDGTLSVIDASARSLLRTVDLLD